MPNGDQILAYIQDVREKALSKGMEGLTDRECQALMAGWQVEQLQKAISPPAAPTMVDRAKGVGIPVVGGAGLLALVQLIRDLLGR